MTAEEVDFAKQPLDEAAVRGIVQAAGSVAAVLNPRHAVVKDRGWVERPPTVDELASVAATEPNVLRRPIFIRGDEVLVGFDKTTKPRWEKLG